MQKKATEPFIRFVGYIDAWEHCALKSLCNLFVDGNWIEAKDQSDTGIRLVQTGNIGTSEYIDKEDKKRWISEETFDRLHCIEIFPGDILISRLPEPAGRACIVPDTGTRMITAVDCTIIRTAGKCDSHYLVQYLSASKYFAAVNAMLGGGTRQRISRGNLAGINIPIPSSKEEQVNIGSFLTELNQLILTHQRKYEKLVNLKKAMLDKMFPKTGELVPEVRFAGFSGNWERRKLGEIACKVTEKNYAEAISETFTNSAENGIISQREYFDHDISNPSNLAGYFVVQENDFIYNPRISSTAPVGPVNRNKLNRKGLVSPIYTVFRTYEIDNLYLEYFFKTRHWHPYMFYNGDSGARSDRFSIKDSLFMSMPIVLPSQSEQKSIGRFLECVDSIIMLQHQKLERLQNLKKAFLEKMFV